MGFLLLVYKPTHLNQPKNQQRSGEIPMMSLWLENEHQTFRKPNSSPSWVLGNTQLIVERNSNLVVKRGLPLWSAVKNMARLKVSISISSDDTLSNIENAGRHHYELLVSCATLLHGIIQTFVMKLSQIDHTGSTIFGAPPKLIAIILDLLFWIYMNIPRLDGYRDYSLYVIFTILLG